MMLIQAIVLLILSIGFIVFPKYMKYYRTDEFFLPVKEPPRSIIIVKRLFGFLLLLISLLLFFGFIRNIIK